jgi:hypothetical protein
VPYAITIPPGSAPEPTQGPELADLFPGGRHFPLARDGLRALVGHLVSGPEAVVTILTTTGSRYVSSCVTEAIGQVCAHARTFTPGTEVALVIHEWGIPYPELAKLSGRCRADGIPLVEDLAYGVGTALWGEGAGGHGDYRLFSLPKFFAVEGGGVLQDTGLGAAGLPEGDPLPRRRVEAPDAIVARRREVWHRYEELFEPSPVWGPSARVVPEVFLLRASEGEGVFVRDRLRADGIEAGFWYGNDHLFLPAHQRLDPEDQQRVRDRVVAAREAWRGRAAG